MILKTNRKFGCKFLVILILISFSSTKMFMINTQANLVEEEDFYRIYSGIYFNLIIPKFTAPEMEFLIENWGSVKIKFNYLSEYNCPTRFLNSLDYLNGKGYSLENLEWDMYGLAEPEKTYVNLTRDKLDRNTIIELSTIIFNTNVTIDEFNLKALQTTYIEMKLSNWTYSPNVNGLALNILSFMVDENNYRRLGPYSIIENNQFAVRIWHSKYAFEFHFPGILTIIKDTNEEEQLIINSFQTYNPALESNNPADFWISIPKIADLKQITFQFICEFETLITHSSLFLSFGWTILCLLLLAIPISVTKRKRRRIIV